MDWMFSAGLSGNWKRWMPTWNIRDTSWKPPISFSLPISSQPRCLGVFAIAGAATREIIDFQKKQLQLVEKRYEAGAVSISDVLAQRAELAQSQATLPALEKNLSYSRHQLAVLVGKLPSEIQLPEFELESMTLPQELPVSMPSSLVRQRPDIRAAEALLHAAGAEVGVATANLYPRLH